jgi:hypothetical protein
MNVHNIIITKIDKMPIMRNFFFMVFEFLQVILLFPSVP